MMRLERRAGHHLDIIPVRFVTLLSNWDADNLHLPLAVSVNEVNDWHFKLSMAF